MRRARQEKLFEEAAQLRADFESGNLDQERLALLVWGHAEKTGMDVSLEETELTIPYALSIFPEDCCDIATVAMKDRLNEGILRGGTYYENEHTILVVGWMGRIAVDITADQFGGPEIYVGPIEEPWSLEA